MNATASAAQATGTVNSDPIVRIIDLHKSFGPVEVLKGVDLEVHRGQVVVILGRSGSGKSTMLRCVNHLERPSRGTVVVDGEVIGYRVKGHKLYELPSSAIAKQRTKTGMVFQAYNLFPHMTVLENLIEAPRRVKGVNRDKAVADAMQALEEVGMALKADAYPGTLSGGQQQRVAIARALVMKPSVMLFDEPTSALDPELVGEVLNVMRRLATSGMTMMVVTHEIGFARSVADEVVFMSEGQLVEKGPPSQVIDAPLHESTRAFIDSIL
ncbi:amino acid ABC transporter ATP-binding protein [Streptomyces chartreusis]|uniref:ABC-type polar-amino-acid transporter n=1 Tax=Streptomyces chartreusis TaxID=1969 RepID=A0A7H8T1A8_STRCX|nr:amino acid ABC transporter ATP-binding protein [Streptomyces chartreusis]QKZ17154.1 amino acid ABC transporter ATP-binding protein [Streptomyces chartreusis]